MVTATGIPRNKAWLRLVLYLAIVAACRAEKPPATIADSPARAPRPDSVPSDPTIRAVSSPDVGPIVQPEREVDTDTFRVTDSAGITIAVTIGVAACGQIRWNVESKPLLQIGEQGG